MEEETGVQGIEVTEAAGRARLSAEKPEELLAGRRKGYCGGRNKAGRKGRSQVVEDALPYESHIKTP